MKILKTLYLAKKCRMLNLEDGQDLIFVILLWEMNERKEKANNINKNVNSLPVLIEENMYKKFCFTYDKLCSKWGNINRKLVTLFCERCSICAIRVNRKFNNEVAGKAIIVRNFLSCLQV